MGAKTMLQATAILAKATNASTGVGAYHYKLIVITSRGRCHVLQITAGQAKAMGFKGLKTGGYSQTVNGWFYPGANAFAIN
jgi:hypothetical protein